MLFYFWLCLVWWKRKEWLSFVWLERKNRKKEEWEGKGFCGIHYFSSPKIILIPLKLKRFGLFFVKWHLYSFPTLFPLPSPFSFLFSSLPFYSTKHNLTRFLVVAMERKKKGKDERKRKREEKEKKIIPFDVFRYRKERKEKKC